MPNPDLKADDQKELRKTYMTCECRLHVGPRLPPRTWTFQELCKLVGKQLSGLEWTGYLIVTESTKDVALALHNCSECPFGFDQEIESDEIQVNTLMGLFLSRIVFFPTTSDSLCKNRHRDAFLTAWENRPVVRMITVAMDEPLPTLHKLEFWKQLDALAKDGIDQGQRSCQELAHCLNDFMRKRSPPDERIRRWLLDIEMDKYYKIFVQVGFDKLDYYRGLREHHHTFFADKVVFGHFNAIINDVQSPDGSWSKHLSRSANNE